MVTKTERVKGNYFVNYDRSGIYHCTSCGSAIEYGHDCPKCDHRVDWKNLVIILENYYSAKERYYDVVKQLYLNIL